MTEYQALMTQRELCNRWQVSDATLERWRSEGIVPIYVKLCGQVRYRREDVQGRTNSAGAWMHKSGDVLEYEVSCLRKSTFEAV